VDGQPALTPSAGEIWLADRGDETRRLLFVISEERFHRLAERAVVAPVLDDAPAAPRPWHIRLGDQAVAVNQLLTTPLDRLLERVDRAGFETVRQVRRAVREITT
jgi:mRNA-degrading endonuclease toxin of MazEF toxin-antitoxin module